MKNLWKKWNFIAPFNFQDPGSEFRIRIPIPNTDPAWQFESGSNRIRIRNTAYTEKKKNRAQRQPVPFLVTGRSVQGLLEILLAGGAQLAAQVLREPPQPLLVHVDQREDLEEALDGGQILVVDRLVKSARHDSPYLKDTQTVQYVHVMVHTGKRR